MTPSRPDRHDPDLDPAIEQAYRRLMDRADELETARLRAGRLDVQSLMSEPTVVTEDLLATFADQPNASPELRAYAERVHAGECRWGEIDLLARPLPPEISELKQSASFVWPWTADQPSPAPEPHDDDDYEPPSSWLS